MLCINSSESLDLLGVNCIPDSDREFTSPYQKGWRAFGRLLRRRSKVATIRFGARSGLY